MVPLRRRASFSASTYSDPNEWLTPMPGRNLASTTSFTGIDVIRQYLPRLAEAMIQWQCSVDSAIGQMAYISNDLNRGGGMTGDISEDFLARTYQNLVSCILENGASNSAIYNRLQMVLRDKFEEDQEDARGGSWEPDAHDRTFRLFSAFGEISYQTQSHWLGRVMRDFFLNSAKYLVSTDTNENLGWALCIQNSGMKSKDKMECLHLLTSADPDLEDDLRRNGLRLGYGTSRLQYDPADEMILNDGRNAFRGGRSRNLGMTSLSRSLGNRMGSPFDNRNRWRRPRSALGLRGSGQLEDQVQNVLEAADTLQVESRALARIAGG
ncbi:hypothetical protein B0A55_00211 [Friedmanniomyces simplex]|uniref:Uncharacterized protein n=1 Tax=Friedmanniomyces simplex TaxID=329884 RepID=A0A4U0Y1D5_9PEZI|nr:hypothetical protein B0A55_00211 [Friedmanniomyces simplex]